MTGRGRQELRPLSQKKGKKSSDRRRWKEPRQRRGRRRVGQQHHHQSLRQRQQTERAKNDALRSAARVAGHLVEAVDGGVQELFVNEKRIELEARALLRTIARYRKQSDQWLAATNAVNSVLKEIGDFENWMKIMDFDCKSINAAIRNIHRS